MSFQPLSALTLLDRLKACGIEEMQARTLLEVVESSHENALAHVAKKEDIAFAEIRLEKKIADVRGELKQNLIESELTLTRRMSAEKWQVVGTVIGTGLVAVLMTILARHFGY